MQVYFGDSLEVLSRFEDQSVNLIVTSPPYADARKNTYGGVSPEKYVDWFLPFAQEMFRVLSDDGSFVLNIKERVVSGERSTYVYELVIALRELGWLWTEEYLWHKTTAAPGKWPNRFRDQFEHLYHFTKQKKFVMNQDAVKVPVGDWSKSRLKNLSEKDRTRQESGTQSGVGRKIEAWEGVELVYPGNVLHGAGETQNRGHSAVFPEWIPSWFIKLFSNPGDVVLDPFVGSGTTLVAAHQLGRSSIGIELFEEHQQVLLDRVSSVLPRDQISVIRSEETL